MTSDTSSKTLRAVRDRDEATLNDANPDLITTRRQDVERLEYKIERLNQQIVATSGIIRELTKNRAGHNFLQLQHAFLQLEQGLVRQLNFEKFLFDLSRTFIGLPEQEIDANMERGLAHVGEFLQLDRVTLLEFSPNRTE